MCTCIFITPFLFARFFSKFSFARKSQHYNSNNILRVHLNVSFIFYCHHHNISPSICLIRYRQGHVIMYIINALLVTTPIHPVSGRLGGLVSLVDKLIFNQTTTSSPCTPKPFQPFAPYKTLSTPKSNVTLARPACVL